MRKLISSHFISTILYSNNITSEFQLPKKALLIFPSCQYLGFKDIWRVQERNNKHFISNHIHEVMLKIFERQRETDLIWQFTPQMPAIMAEGLRPGTNSGLPQGWQEPSLLGSSSLPPRVSTGKKLELAGIFTVRSKAAPKGNILKSKCKLED